ncbi:hypothetical protein H310_03280 [Aphanomyces invadans]|uniref:Uncharacterized protein n=1 Tax=Aphanomyces invadans TaxID=157072 RepID=A0A024UGW2_9STRA|nr:hypothetical protein H310_03280 [Aphanomyces invadans]ETW05524.1 hypothetical protein H310_03280 [Aphanomyces invadans]|eukprot:XP_008865301.1 hypothetical protein H310_03280 [Aphanomyces invadans]
MLVTALCVILWSLSVSAHTTPAMTPFPGTSACQRCANDPSQCGDAFKGLPGKYCGPWLSGGVKQACCCPPAARCVIPINAASCGCDSNPTPITKSSSGTPFWAWIVFGIGAIALTMVIWSCCRRRVYEAEPVYVPSGGVAYTSQPPMVVHEPFGYSGGYGYGNRGGSMAAGVAIGTTAGIVGGVLIGEALADGHRNHGDYGGNYAGGDYGGGGGGADFGGDFSLLTRVTLNNFKTYTCATSASCLHPHAANSFHQDKSKGHQGKSKGVRCDCHEL